LLSLLLLFFLSACSQINTLAYEDIADLKELPQKALPYTNSLDQNRSLYEIQSQYAQHYFKAWHMNFSKLSVDAMRWPFKSYTPQNSFGDNLQPISQLLLNQLDTNTNLASYATINLRAITVHQASLRTLPTDKPFFNDPRKAGEGFPFDYLQESSIHANEPIFISHYSLDGAWAYISTSYATGWIHTNDFVLLSDQQCSEFENSKKISITLDDFPIKDDKEQFLYYSKIGMQFPIIQENNSTFYASVIVASEDHNAVYKHITIPKTVATSDVLSLNKQNITTLVDAIVHTHYGWGGMYGERDCSSTLKDLFTPFGIWLPRNSSYQAKVGKVIFLGNLDDNKKIELIKKEGIPFETLLYKKGHILLYTGVYDNKVIVMHNMWGIGISDGDKNGRIIVGKIVFSTLEIGKEQKYHKGSLLSKLDSMNILTLKP
jgi:cell wall-associated NlpC family hydrolase